ncbi:MAG TPA: hypothetical protein VGX92_21025 [Pyrinomonadaceae bacterium]|jgi:hypothetical protein|nr:hypothetical protein [Pyrinomonadaceae bacterium]
MLLCYRTNGLSAEQCTWVSLHLDACEFCGAELQLLMEHRLAEEECPVAEMPLNLRYLAEALLGRKLHGMEVYAETAYDKVPLTLTDA